MEANTCILYFAISMIILNIQNKQVVELRSINNQVYIDLILVRELLLPWWTLALAIPNLMLFSIRSKNARKRQFINYP